MINYDESYLAELVVRAQKKESNAFAELYAATYATQYRIAHGYLDDEYLAMQVLRRGYAMALEHLKFLKNPRWFVDWISQIIFRLCISLGPASTFTVDGRTYPVDILLELPYAQGQALMLQQYLFLNTRQTAELLNRSPRQVRKVLTLARRSLPALYSAHKGSPEEVN